MMYPLYEGVSPPTECVCWFNFQTVTIPDKPGNPWRNVKSRNGWGPGVASSIRMPLAVGQVPHGGSPKWAAASRKSFTNIHKLESGRGDVRSKGTTLTLVLYWLRGQSIGMTEKPCSFATELRIQVPHPVQASMKINLFPISCKFNSWSAHSSFESGHA